jgi:iron complex transport system substrate-binding protein
MQSDITLYSFLFLLLINGCTGRVVQTEKDPTNGKSDYIEYAKRFDIQENDGFSVLTIKNPWQGAQEITQRYYLLKRGKRIPEGVDSMNVIRVPVRKIICMSTTHLAMISALKEEESIRGVSGSNYLYEKKLIDLIESNRIADVGYEDNLNKELIIQIEPDLVMVYGIGSESVGYLGKLKELGIKILFNADYLETDPLGKAEWIKLFGALYLKKNEADSIFKSTSVEYNGLKSFIAFNTQVKPSVFLGLPWKDTWFISPGNSYISQLISDAGGEYIWKDTQSEISMPFGIENVYIKAMNADFWLNPGSVKNKKEIRAIDIRLCDLPAFKNGKIYNSVKRMTSVGGNDYWESGTVNPQILLKDIASILHPDLFKGHELFFYKKIE